MAARRRGCLAAALLAASLLAASAASAQPAATAPTENWATARARVLTEQGSAHRAAGNTDLAIARFLDAIAIDGTFGPAYLALGSLREASGETEEALRVLDMALERIPSFEEAMEARASLFARSKRWKDATSSYLQLLEVRRDDERTLQRLVELAPRAGLLPVALGASRRIYVLATERGDAAVARDAKLTTRALEKLIAEADPVQYAVQGARGARDPVRRALALLTASRPARPPPAK